MKKIFTTAMLALLGAGAFAQSTAPTTQGTKVVSGYVSFNNETSETEMPDGRRSGSVYRIFYFSPSAGYFIRDGLELGIGLGLRHYAGISKSDDVKKSQTRNNQISLSPYIRKYIAITDQLQLHGTGYASFGIGNGASKEDQDSSFKVTHTSNTIGIGVHPGLTYFATPKLGFTATFGTFYFERSSSKSKEKQSNSNSSSSSHFRADLTPSSIGIGINYFITR